MGSDHQRLPSTVFCCQDIADERPTCRLLSPKFHITGAGLVAEESWPSSGHCYVSILRAAGTRDQTRVAVPSSFDAERNGRNKGRFADRRSWSDAKVEVGRRRKCHMQTAVPRKLQVLPGTGILPSWVLSGLQPTTAFCAAAL